ncbi:hypothetical protein [Bacillus testis]|uniref:hypothetical protein n=1 Tax=Bacillus testis TaxID=1622072 RepID=UPI00067F0A89|nr:hypothetical protein [Bacillus testis]
MKKLLIGLFLGTILVLSACGGEDSKPASKQVKYEIVKDTKFTKTEQREIRVTTKANKKDFNAITEEVMDKYKDKKLDSIHLYIHAPEGEDYGTLKAHSFIAYTQKGVAQTGLDKANSYKVEVEKQQQDYKTIDVNDQSSEKWQQSFREIAISEAERYIELTEKNGELPADRLEEHSGVIQLQADKLVNNEEKQSFTDLASLVKGNKLNEVKVIVQKIKK